jgi:hypothetical protein
MKVTACLLLVACGSATGPTTPDAEHVTVGSVAVTPGTVATKRGLDAPTQLAAKVTLSNQATADITAAATWTSSNPAAATVDPNGLVTPVGAGMATITASYEGVEGTSVVSTTNPRIYMTETTPPGIDVFDTYATGDVAPIQAITGGATTLSFPWQVEVADDEIYVSDPNIGAISVWPITATGNVMWTRQIKSPMMLTSGYGIAVFNHEIYVAVSNAGVGSILVFPSDANGSAVAPTRQITSTNLTGGIYGLKIYNNEIYAADLTDQAIQVFPANGSGALAPLRTIKGTLTTIAGIESLTVDHDEIFIANLNSIRVFPTSGDGNIAPLRAIVGADTGLGSVITAAVVGDEVVTANYATGGGGIHVHPRNATSDAPPLRNINGPVSTTIKSPRLLTVY